ncbi:MAG: hypothetical protein HY340_00710 [Candidatus Kerfeldbacteria bacterium]|nr:hypothetical protein [Candidatus Kerfeldbacteria bacterium]
MKSPRGLTVVAGLVALAIISAVIVAGVVLSSRQATAPSDTNQTECTLEAKLCPDGSSVSRVAPSCEFAACPEVDTNSAVNTNSSDITAGWETYTNEKLGLSFRYPPSWGTPKAVEDDATSNPSDYNKGKTLTISFGPFPSVPVQAGIIAASDGAQRFKQSLYDGGDDLTRGCLNPGIATTKFEDWYTICRTNTIAGQATYELFSNDGDECSFWNTHSVRLNLTGGDYSGISIAQSFDSEQLCIPKQGMTEAEMTVFNRNTAKKELENLYQRNGLERAELTALEDFTGFLSSFTFTE